MSKSDNRQTLPPFETEDGWTTYNCKECGADFEVDDGQWGDDAPSFDVAIDAALESAP